jgi:response regulator RpfG family c-di-GMP phosphodiesterase
MSTLRAARAAIEKWSGRQFGPNVVKVFLEIPEKVWIVESGGQNKSGERA